MSALRASKGFLLLEDGTLFHGHIHAASNAPAVAEVVFTTNMSGYQEVFTDPSYRGQIVVMTSPMIGNYGVNAEDPESTRAQVSGVVVRELSTTFSNWRVLRGVIGAGEAPDAAARAALEACPSMSGLDLASVVSTSKAYSWGNAGAATHIVAYDYGIKHNILRLFEDRDCRITVVPSTATASEVLALEPDGVFLSNGPGDPEAVTYAMPNIRAIADQKVPVFGICLGNQLVGLTYGATTFKLPYGHRGGNHPVKDLATGKVLITSQNHGFAVKGTADAIPGAPDLEVTHVNLNDGSIEGLRHKRLPVFAVQFHPEAAPGPHDARALFDDFMKAVEARS